VNVLAHPRRMLIGGELVESESGSWLETINPANEDVLGKVPLGGAADVSRAVAAAAAAATAWSDMGVKERARHLRLLGQKLTERTKEILAVEVADTGNTVTRLSGDVAAAVEALDYFAGLGLEMKGETIPASPHHLHLTIRQPYGVVGRIAPFNHPIMFAAGGLAAPLMAGNAVVMKPPEQSPLSATILAEICAEIFPKGVVNIVTGYGAEAGDALVRHKDVKRIAFIGSVPTGRAIQRAAAETGVKHVSLELGGKNPMIIFPDVDLDEAVNAAIGGMNFAWQGQSCGSTSRLLLHESLHDTFVEKLVARIKELRIGDPASTSSQMGPVNSESHYNRVLRYVEAGELDGATLATGGKRPSGADFTRGFWIEPTVFTDVTSDMRIAAQEIFGPVLSVMRWKTFDEAVAIANSTEYGLTASIWTRDIKQALRAAKAVNSGYIWINGFSAHYRGTPFGGLKNSGIGREEGLDDLLSYTETKAIHVIL
jgi:betaine-aldehyde dehydrogenase